MTMQAANTAALVPTAQVIGNAFVEQYYHILHQSPELVHKFYQDSSVLSRPDANGIITSVTTMQAIDDKIQSLDYKNYKAEIRTADAQDSYQTGVIVLVTGYLTGKDNVKRKFTQTFFLAPQEKGYFVLNDIFRYIEENESFEDNSASANGVDTDEDTRVPLAPDTEPINLPASPVMDPSTSLETEDLHNGAEVCDPSDNEEGSVIEQEMVNEPPNHSIQNETVPDVSLETLVTEEKKSYAYIVKVPKVSTPSTFVYVPRGPHANTDQQAHNSAKPSFEPTSAPTSNSIPESSTNQDEVEGRSIYIRNLPLDATYAQLEEVFKQFGSIRRGGIQVRNNKGFCFGFVEFESVSSKQNAIKASPVTVGGRQAVVEEKRTTTRVGSGARTRFPSGRAFHSDSSYRGRGNLGGGRVYGRIEFRNQGDFLGRPRGPTGRNVESYQRVNQNEGARSSRQGGVNKSAASA